MPALLGILLIAYVMTQAISAARIDHTYAKQGLVSPRLQAKYGMAAKEKTARYGLLDYFGDAWSDHWQRRAAALAADREAFVANPGQRVRLRDRLANAKRVMATVGRKLVEPVPVKPVAEPVDVAPLEPPPALAVDTGDIPVGTVRYTHLGRARWDGTDWKPAPKPKLTTVPAPAVDRSVTSTRGGTMSAPTGEAVNYETTVAELEALANEQRGHVDHCQAALKSIGDAKSAINNMQESYRASAAAASLTSEHLAAKNLDGVTLANAGTTADAMPAGAVDQMYDQLEAMEAEASARLADAEVALGATAANLAHVVATYSAAHETVAGNLSGDSSFLDSHGGLSAGQAGGNHLAGTAAGLTGTVDPFSAGPGGSGGDNSPITHSN